MAEKYFLFVNGLLGLTKNRIIFRLLGLFLVQLFPLPRKKCATRCLCEIRKRRRRPKDTQVPLADGDARHWDDLCPKVSAAIGWECRPLQNKSENETKRDEVMNRDKEAQRDSP